MVRRGLAAGAGLLALTGAALGSIEINGRQLLVDGEPFLIRGVAYSPVPSGLPVDVARNSDFFADEYAYIWRRDLPLLKAMGANAVRIYRWLPENDHTLFLDTLHENGLKLMATYFMSSNEFTNISTSAQREGIINDFLSEVRKYKSHPAILVWTFGNELNGPWMGDLQALSDDAAGYGSKCGWDAKTCVTYGAPPAEHSHCWKASACVYERFFGFVDDAAKAAKKEANVLVTSAFADIDAFFPDKVKRMGDTFAPNVDVWTAQLYRGRSFFTFFDDFDKVTAKPVIITEYGVDAFHDICGTEKATVCNCELGQLGIEGCGHVDGAAQADYDVALTKEIQAHGSHNDHCLGAGRGHPECATVGGFLMAWLDEYWKGDITQGKCKVPYGQPGFNVSQCSFKAHVTCPCDDTSRPSLCGYWLAAFPDQYVNEEWFGLTSIGQRCSYGHDALRPRQVYWDLRQYWLGLGEEEGLFTGCAEGNQASEALLNAEGSSSSLALSGSILALALSFGLLASVVVGATAIRRHHTGEDQDVGPRYISIAA